MAMRFALFSDIIGMAFDTLRANKLRASLTILGVVIGITAIVGMTSLIRGFDESLRDSIRELGPNTLFVAKFSGLSFASGKEFKDLIKRPGAHRGGCPRHRARGAVGRQGRRLAGRLGRRHPRARVLQGREDQAARASSASPRTTPPSTS